MSYGSIPLLAAVAALEALAIGFVALRLACRHWRKVAYGVDDWLILASLGFESVCTAVWIWACATHLFDLPKVYPTQTPEQHDEWGHRLKTSGKIEQFIQPTLVIVALGLARHSAIYLYKRIFVLKWQQIVIWALLIYNILWIVAFTFQNIFLCGTHFDVAYDPDKDYEFDQYCYSEPPYPQVISSLIGDVATALLPVPMVWRLQMPRNRRLMLSGTFMIIAISVVFSVTKTATWLEFLVFDGSHAEFSRKQRAFLFWQQAEVLVFIMLVCAVVIAPAAADTRIAGSIRHGIQSLQERMTTRSHSTASTQGRQTFSGTSLNATRLSRANDSMVDIERQPPSSPSLKGEFPVISRAIL